MSDQDLIITRVEDGIGYLTFNRPDKMNAFNNELMQDAIAAMDGFAADDDVHVVIVSGAGRTFSASRCLGDGR